MTERGVKTLTLRVQASVRPGLALGRHSKATIKRLFTLANYGHISLHHTSIMESGAFYLNSTSSGKRRQPTRRKGLSNTLAVFLRP